MRSSGADSPGYFAMGPDMRRFFKLKRFEEVELWDFFERTLRGEEGGRSRGRGAVGGPEAW